MARIEKTVFISYRRKDISWALAVYQYLTSRKYDVFFDYTSLSGGDFEQVIVSNIKARAHFVLILTPSALDRCNEPGDWLRREIETAVDEKRNIIPLFFDGFNFSNSSVAEKLIGKLATINRYNGLDVPAGYFIEAMERLRARYLKVPLSAVIHPVSTEVRKVVKEEKVAANLALREQKEDIQELVKPAQEKIEKQKQYLVKESLLPLSARWKGVIERISSWFKKINPRPFGIGMGILLISALGIYGINSLIQKLGEIETPPPTQTRKPAIELPFTSTHTIATGTETVHPIEPTLNAITPTQTATIPPFTPTSEIGIGSTFTGKDSMTQLYVPAGEFTMGSDNGSKDEKPVHTVYLDSYWVDQTEVTNVLYAEFLNDVISQISIERDEWDEFVVYSNNTIYIVNCKFCENKISWNGTKFIVISGYEDHPVVLVTWNGAQSYCSWVNRRLLTEAEWEKAASWDDEKRQKYVYPWGNDFNGSFLNFCDKNCTAALADKNSDDGFANTSPVGSYSAGTSPYGALDMAGNVSEWVQDWYYLSYYSNSPPANPPGPDSGQGHVVRGGSWSIFRDYVRSTSRSLEYFRSDHVGFRCAMDAE